MHKLFVKYGIYALMFSMLTSCITNDDILVGESVNASATKIINSPNDAESGSLLIKLNEGATRLFESAKDKKDITRSNITSLNYALQNIGATSIERLFPIDSRHEERTRKAGLHRWYVVRFNSSENLETAAKTLSEIEEIEIVQYNSLLEYQPSKVSTTEEDTSTRLTVSEVNDPLFTKQWHYYNTGSGVHEGQVAGMDINVRDAWRYCTGDPSIIVAVIDEGVDFTHEDLKDNMWVNAGEIPGDGKDNDGNGFVDDIHGFNHYTGGVISWNEATDSGHGTHVAGTVAAVNNNGIGVCGIAGGDGSGNGVRIMSSQMFSGKTKGTAEVSARAFKYAADNGAVIAQCSWGSAAKSYQNDYEFRNYAGVEYDGIRYFQAAKNSDVLDGGLVIFASGNDSVAMSGYPAAYRDIISVASVGCDGMPANYTNFGPGTNISAPGGDQDRHGKSGGVYSTLPKRNAPSGYGYMQGTSMACPHVSGVAALGLSYAKKLGKKFSLEEFTAMLLLSVDNIDNDMLANPNPKYGSYYVGKMGSGRINALRMLMNVEGTPCISITRDEICKIDLRPYLGDGSLDLKIRNISMSDADKMALEVTGTPQTSGNSLIIQCKSTGHGHIEVETVIGGDVAGSDNKMGGRVTTKKIALIVRDSHTANGGWL